MKEVILVFIGVFLGGAIMISSLIVSVVPLWLFVVGFPMTFGSGCYFYYRMDHPRPKFFNILENVKECS